MKKKIITYGVHGLMEYQAVIKLGRSTMKVLFTDGSMNAMGTNPATYTTDNLMIQHAIEHSEQFKRGRIRIVRTVTLDEEVRIDRNAGRVAGIAESPKAPESQAVESAPAAGAESAVQSEAEIEQDKTSAPEAESATMTEMEFDNNDDAKDFLETKYGYIRSKLRNRADIIAAGKAHGIAISFT